MKRTNNRIEYNETGRYAINPLTERYIYDWFQTGEEMQVKVTHLSSYQICNVYTNKNSSIPTYLKLNGIEASYQIVFDEHKCSMSEQDRVIVAKQLSYDNSHNCHGFTFLDGQFWFLLNNEKVNRIIQEDDYQPCRKQDLKEDGVCLYYDFQNKFIHSGKVVEGRILSKFGINVVMTQSEEEIYDRYGSSNIDSSKTKYYNPYLSY